MYSENVFLADTAFHLGIWQIDFYEIIQRPCFFHLVAPAFSMRNSFLSARGMEKHEEPHREVLEISPGGGINFHHIPVIHY